MAFLDEIKDEYRELAAELQTQRDEIKVRAHLLGMEAAEEWKPWRRSTSSCAAS